MKIKICGLQRVEDVAYVNECKPDYVGFVFADSKRKVTKKQAKQLKERLNPDIITVGVFVNEDIAVIMELVKDGIIDVVQLHGDEDNEYIERLRENLQYIQSVGAASELLKRNYNCGGNCNCRMKPKIIKAIRVAIAEGLEGCETIPADYLLFDTFSPKERGGTGEVFDWGLLKRVGATLRRVGKDFFLAGGINGDNVAQARVQVNPYAVDVSSAVETAGFKDREKIIDIVRKVRSLGGT